MGIAGRDLALGIAFLFAALPLQGGVPDARFVRVAVPSGAAQEPSLEEVLSRAARYVADFHHKLSGIVAEERYTQQVQNTGGFGRRNTEPALLPSKTLGSDLLLVRPLNADRYVEFRDVFEVNGVAVRDRDERLTKLFLAPTAANMDQIAAVIEESARHNIGNIPRTINTPMLTLLFLQEHTQSRFRFRRSHDGGPSLGTKSNTTRDPAVFRVTTEMWVIEFKERHKPTIVRTNARRDFPAAGRFWINPATGAVLMSELVMDSSDVSAVINVSYQSEPLLGFMVPIEMRERYRTRSERLEGIATYGKFRQFQVKTAEAIGKPPGTLQ